MVQLKDGTEVEDVRLDRLVEFDDRSREYPIRRLLLTTVLRTKTWELPRSRFVDQGQEGACVSAGFGHDSAAAPVPTAQLTMVWLRGKVYFVAQNEDPWPGGAYPGASPFYEGTSVLSGAKVMQRYGFFDNYHWAFSIDELASAVINVGTVVLGLPWTEGQMNPDPTGVIKYEGSVQGGHCVCCRGIWVPNSAGRITRIPGSPRINEPVAVIPQSWGLDHGNRGEVYMPLSELEQALKDDGECCVPTSRKRVNIKTLKV